MLSDVDSPKDEGWKMIDSLEVDKVCSLAEAPNVPHVFHYCQRYFLGPWFFAKYSLPVDFFSCEHPLLAVPNASVIRDYKSALLWSGELIELPKRKTRKRHAFFLCQILQRLNQAAVYYKNKQCTVSNRSLSYMWPKPEKKKKHEARQV
jgi:hypothetical protein